MLIHRALPLLVTAVLLLWPAKDANAQQVDEDAYAMAAYMLDQAVNPLPDGPYNAYLRGLRYLEDPELLPLFNILFESPYAPQRVHGTLGLAELHPDNELDLVSLAEIEDPRELVEVLSAAIDDGLIGVAGMQSVMGWNDLALPVRQAVAMDLVSAGEEVDGGPMHASLELAIDRSTPVHLLMQHAMGALILAELGDPAGEAALLGLAGLDNPSAELVLAQLFDGAMRRGLSAVGPLAVRVGMDTSRSSTLRLTAMQTALRLEAPGGAELWTQTYNDTTDLARRIRLSLIALDAALVVEAGMFDTLLADDLSLIQAIGRAGRAIASGQADTTEAITAMIQTGAPIPANWVVTYCRRVQPENAPQLLSAVIGAYAHGADSNRAALAESGVFAAQALCELYPQVAAVLLPALLSDAPEDAREEQMLRQIVLLGLVRSRGVDLVPIVAPIPPPTADPDAVEPLHLLMRGRCRLELSDEAWDTVAQIVLGSDRNLDPALRMQFAWVYLVHHNRHHQAIQATLD